MLSKINADILRTPVRAAIQSALEAEMTEALAERSERGGSRLGHRSGAYSRLLITRVDKIELRLPRDRSALFSTGLYERRRSGLGKRPGRDGCPGGLDL